MRSPQLVRAAGGAGVQGTLEFRAVTKVEEDADFSGLPILSRAVRLKEERTQEDRDWNRALVVGRLKPSSPKAPFSVEVLNTVEVLPEDAPGSVAAPDAPVALGCRRVSARPVPLEGSSFVNVQADSANGVVGGWVHNRKRLDPQLILEQATRNKLAGTAGASKQTHAALKSKIKESSDWRAEVLREVLKEHKAARDRNKLLISAMPATLAQSALVALACAPSLAPFGGPDMLRPVVAAIGNGGSIRSTAELQAKALLELRKVLTAHKLREVDPAWKAVLGDTSAAKESREREGWRGELRAVVEGSHQSLSARHLVNQMAPLGWRATKRLTASLSQAHPEWMWLQKSAVMISQLPRCATREDVSRSVAQFMRGAADVAGGAADGATAMETDGAEAGWWPSEVILSAGTGSRVAYVGCRSVEAAKALVEACGKGQGIPMRFDAQVATNDLLIGQRSEEFDKLAPSYEEAKATFDEADAATEAKRSSLSNEKAWKKFASTAAGKAMAGARAAANRVLQARDDSGETLSKRFGEAKRGLELAKAGHRLVTEAAADVSAPADADKEKKRREVGPRSIVELCGKGAGEVRRTFASLLLAELESGVEGARKAQADALVRLAEITPYVEKLETAEKRGLDAEMVEQSGFQELFQLERHEPATAICPICYETVGEDGDSITSALATRSSSTPTDLRPGHLNSRQARPSSPRRARTCTAKRACCRGWPRWG